MAVEPPTPQHAKLRLSIRLPRPLWIGVAAVVLIVTGVGLQIGIPAYQRHVAIGEVERAGGTVRTRPRVPAWLRAGVREEWVKPFDEVYEIDLQRSEATDSTLRHVGRLTDVEWLWLEHSRVTDAGLPRLKELTRLESIDLSYTQVSDAGMMCLEALAELKSLELNYSRVTDAGLARLKGLSKLRRLSLQRTQVTDVGVAELQRALPGLTIYRGRSK